MAEKKYEVPVSQYWMRRLCTEVERNTRNVKKLIKVVNIMEERDRIRFRMEMSALETRYSIVQEWESSLDIQFGKEVNEGPSFDHEDREVNQRLGSPDTLDDKGQHISHINKQLQTYPR